MANNDRLLRIMWNSNAFWSVSGYGSQMYYMLPFLRDAGWNQAQIAFYGLEGGKVQIDGITCYPKIGDVWGTDAMIEHGKDFKSDVTVTFQDIWVLNDQALRAIPRWIPFVPIDHEPPPPAVTDRLKLAYRIVTHSKFGQNALRKAGLHSDYIPLVVDTDTFVPQDKVAIKKALGIPEDMFVFGMVAANKENPPRKSFQEAMDAFKLFHERHPRSAMYFHSNTQQMGGFPIQEYAKVIGIERAIYFTPVYEWMFKVDRQKMAQIIGMFDCLLSPSTSEGFGVPIIEAQSCGVPVVVNNFSAMPELIEPGVTGEMCEVAYRRFSPIGSFIGIPDVKSLHEAMERVYAYDHKKAGKAARDKMVKEYDTKVVLPLWNDFFEKVQREVYPDIDKQPSVT